MCSHHYKHINIIAHSNCSFVVFDIGCNSEFEGEVLWGEYSLELMELILEAAFEIFNPETEVGGSAGIAVANGQANVGIKPMNFLWEPIRLIFGVFKKSWGQLGKTCAYIDSYVQLAKVEATFENSIWALKELACRDAANNKMLQRGYGCDGLDSK